VTNGCCPIATSPTNGDFAPGVDGVVGVVVVEVVVVVDFTPPHPAVTPTTADASSANIKVGVALRLDTHSLGQRDPGAFISIPSLSEPAALSKVAARQAATGLNGLPFPQSFRNVAGEPGALP
jgi:hypothetical protein